VPAENEVASEPIVRLRGVSKTYPNQAAPALVPTDLDIRQGEFFSLLGPSGSGKTTTLRLIAGFEIPDTGRVFIQGVDVTLQPPFRRDVKTVFQGYALFPHMTVQDNVAYPLRMERVAQAEIGGRVQAALELVEMGGFSGRLPHQLSGGQKQRVALARALVARPKVLLLDEPLGALDLQLRQQMQSVLRRLQRELGISFVYVTHDQGEALSMSDRLAVMNRGAIQQLSVPEDVYYRPHNRFVASFIGKANLVECRIEREAGVCTAVNGPFRVRLDGDYAAGPATIAIRFESFIFGPTEAGDNRLSGRIETATFLGDGREVQFAIGDIRLTARITSQHDRKFVPGDGIDFGVRRADIVVLHD
jgi:spermidine/putrescine transport system ATP-binding protein